MENNEEQRIRIKLPRNGELVGVIDQRVGGSRMIVKCSDGISRNCKVPGRLRRNLWIREGDYIIVKPWEFDNTKGDILFKYNSNDIRVLRERGLLNNLESEF